MKKHVALLLSAAIGLAAVPASADTYGTTFVSLGQGQPALLYDPQLPGPKALMRLRFARPLLAGLALTAATSAFAATLV